MDILSYKLSKKYTDEVVARLGALSGTSGFEAMVVSSLPAVGIPGVLYLVPSGTTKKLKNIYNEFI